MWAARARRRAIVRRIQASTCSSAAASAAATSESAARIGIAFRCAGPVRQCSPCQPRPARQCSHDSNRANAKQVVTKRTAARTASRREAKPRRRSVLQQRALADAESREPDDAGRDNDSQNDRNDRDERQRRAPGPALERLRQRRRRERVRDRPGREDDERAAPEPRRRSGHLHGGKDRGVTRCLVLATVVVHIFGGTPAAVDHRATISSAPPGVETRIVAGDRLWLKVPNGQVHEHRLAALDGRWRVPAGTVGIVSGTLVKLPRPAIWPWIALGVLLAIAAAAAFRWRGLAVVFPLVTVVAAVTAYAAHTPSTVLLVLIPLAGARRSPLSPTRRPAFPPSS